MDVLVRACNAHPNLGGAEALDRCDGFLGWPGKNGDSAHVDGQSHQIRIAPRLPRWNSPFYKNVEPDPPGEQKRQAGDETKHTGTLFSRLIHHPDSGRLSRPCVNFGRVSHPMWESDPNVCIAEPFALVDPNHGTNLAVSWRGWAALTAVIAYLGHYVQGRSGMAVAELCGADCAARLAAQSEYFLAKRARQAAIRVRIEKRPHRPQQSCLLGPRARTQSAPATAHTPTGRTLLWDLARLPEVFTAAYLRRASCGPTALAALAAAALQPFERTRSSRVDK